MRGVEFFEFSDGAGGVILVATADFIPVVGVTPTAWGLTDNDGDNAPDTAGTPDVDGFVANHAPQSLAGDQTNPFVADIVGEFIGVVWESPGSDGNSHIKGQFYDVVLGFDEFMPNVVNLSDGIGLETNPVLVSGGANSGWGIAFEERDDALDATRVIRTNFQGPGFLTGVEQSVLDEGPNVDQHDAALSGSFLDRTLESPVAGSVLTQSEWDEMGEHARTGIQEARKELPRDVMAIQFGLMIATIPEDERPAWMKQNLPAPVRLLYTLLLKRRYERAMDELYDGRPVPPIP